MTDHRVGRREFLVTSGTSILAAIGGCTTVSTIPADDERDVTNPPSVDTRDDVGSNSPAETSTDRPYASLYEDVAPSVVELRVAGTQAQLGQGSGFVIDGGYVVTNQHVVTAADRIDVGFRENEWIRATSIGEDVHSDLAVVEVDDPPVYATELEFDRGIPSIGTRVVAIGSPFGLGGSASVGIVSGVNRSLPNPTGFSIPAAIQTDAAVNPGNSGGPLVRLDGSVVGVVFATSGQNIGFAISAPLARRVLPALIESGEYEHSYVGVRLTSVTPVIAEENDLPNVRGVVVVEVLDGEPADGVLRGADRETFVDGVVVPVGGDVIVSIDGTATNSMDDLSAHLALETFPGDNVRVTVVRDGRERTLELTLGSRPM